MRAKDLYSIPIDSIEDALWEVGLNSHRISNDERICYINYLNSQREVLSSKILLTAVGYIMHTFFSAMSDLEREKYIELLINIESISPSVVGDIYDMIGILFKGCPMKIKNRLFQYILDKSLSCLSEPSAIISLCNCFTYIYDEVGTTEKEYIIEKLRTILSKNPYRFIDDSIEFTINSLVR